MQSNSKSSRLKDFLNNPKRGLWTLAIPMMVGMAIQTIYTIVDMIFVGKVSADALTALAFNMPLLFFGIGITFGLGSGITAIIAQYIGAEDKRNADNSAEHAVVLGIIIGILITTMGLIWGKSLLSTLGVPPILLSTAWSYFQVMASGFIFIVMSVFFRSILNGEGDMKTPMLIQGGGTILNIVLDPIFIFGLGMGVRGAAIATIASQAVATFVFIFLLFIKGQAYITFALRDFKFSRSILSKIFMIGVPASFSFLIMSFGGGVFNKILITFSGEAVAAYQVGSRLDHIFFLPIISIAASLVTLVGMFYGANRIDLIRMIIRYAISRSVMIGFVIAVIFFIFAPQMLSVFSNNPDLHSTGANYLRIFVFSYPFIPIGMLSGRILQGLGRGAPMLIITTLRVILISAPLAYIFVFWMDKPVEWVWIAMVISVWCAAAIALLWLRSGLRRLKVKEVIVRGENFPGDIEPKYIQPDLSV